jgi:hypothetical protein
MTLLPGLQAIRFITRDSLSLHHKALLIYQELIRFHLTTGNKEALIDIDHSTPAIRRSALCSRG